MELRRIVRGRQTGNGEFAARDPLICGAKSGDYRGRNRPTLPFSRVLWIAPGPNPDLAAFDGRLPADCNAMRHLEARAVKFGDLGGDVRHIVELGGSEKAGLGVHQRYSDDSEGHRQFIRFHLKRFLEKTPHAPIEILEEAAVEHDASRVAVTPFDRELPAQNEITHARNRFSTGGYARRHKKPACAQDVKSSGMDEKALKSGYAAEKPKKRAGVVNVGAQIRLRSPRLEAHTCRCWRRPRSVRDARTSISRSSLACSPSELGTIASSHSRRSRHKRPLHESHGGNGRSDGSGGSGRRDGSRANDRRGGSHRGRGRHCG